MTLASVNLLAVYQLIGLGSGIDSCVPQTNREIRPYDKTPK